MVASITAWLIVLVAMYATVTIAANSGARTIIGTIRPGLSQLAIFLEHLVVMALPRILTLVHIEPNYAI